MRFEPPLPARSHPATPRKQATRFAVLVVSSLKHRASAAPEAGLLVLAKPQSRNVDPRRLNLAEIRQWGQVLLPLPSFEDHVGVDPNLAEGKIPRKAADTALPQGGPSRALPSPGLRDVRGVRQRGPRSSGESGESRHVTLCVLQKRKSRKSRVDCLGAAEPHHALHGLTRREEKGVNCRLNKATGWVPGSGLLRSTQIRLGLGQSSKMESDFVTVLWQVLPEGTQLASPVVQGSKRTGSPWSSS